LLNRIFIYTSLIKEIFFKFVNLFNKIENECFKCRVRCKKTYKKCINISSKMGNDTVQKSYPKKSMRKIWEKLKKSKKFYKFTDFTVLR
jgi:hypothetical protein